MPADTTVQKNGHTLRYANKRLQDNEDVVRLAVQQDGEALRYAKKRPKSNEDVVKLAVQKKWKALQYAGDIPKNNDQIVSAACSEFRMLMRHRAVRKDRHEGEQRSTNARVHHRAVRKDIHAGMCPGRCGQKRCVQSAVARCASLHVSRSTRWQRRGQKSHTRNHCHLCHACRSSCLSIYLSICKLENEAIRRDFLNFFT